MGVLILSPENFVYWLRGFFEIQGEGPISKEQAEIISKHLTLVFKEEAKLQDVISKATSALRSGFIHTDDSLRPKLCSYIYTGDPCGRCGKELSVGSHSDCSPPFPYQYLTTVSC